MEGEGGRVCHATDRPRSGDPLLYAGPGRLPHRGRTVHRPTERQVSRKTPGGPPWLNSYTGRQNIEPTMSPEQFEAHAPRFIRGRQQGLGGPPGRAHLAGVTLQYSRNDTTGN